MSRFLHGDDNDAVDDNNDDAKAITIPQVFSKNSQAEKAFSQGCEKSTIPTTLGKKLFENNVGKEENAGYQHFLLFLHCFLPLPQQHLIFYLCLIVFSKCFQFEPV